MLIAMCVAACVAASAALALSPVPWLGPVGAVRIGYCDDEWFVNPTRKELQHSNLDLIVTAGPKKTVGETRIHENCMECVGLRLFLIYDGS